MCGKSPSRNAYSLRVSSSRFWVKQGRQWAMNQSASGQCIPSSASCCLRSAASNSWLPVRCSYTHLTRAESRSAAFSRRFSSAVSRLPEMKGLTSSASSGGSRRVMESTLSVSSAL